MEEMFAVEDKFVFFFHDAADKVRLHALELADLETKFQDAQQAAMRSNPRPNAPEPNDDEHGLRIFGASGRVSCSAS